jgi:hypothetical protein
MLCIIDGVVPPGSSGFQKFIRHLAEAAEDGDFYRGAAPTKDTDSIRMVMIMLSYTNGGTPEARMMMLPDTAPGLAALFADVNARHPKDRNAAPMIPLSKQTERATDAIGGRLS